MQNLCHTLYIPEHIREREVHKTWGGGGVYETLSSMVRVTDMKHSNWAAAQDLCVQEDKKVQGTGWEEYCL